MHACLHADTQTDTVHTHRHTHEHTHTHTHTHYPCFQVESHDRIVLTRLPWQHDVNQVKPQDTTDTLAEKKQNLRMGSLPTGSFVMIRHRKRVFCEAGGTDQQSVCDGRWKTTTTEQSVLVRLCPNATQIINPRREIKISPFVSRCRLTVLILLSITLSIRLRP